MLKTKMSEILEIVQARIEDSRTPTLVSRTQRSVWGPPLAHKRLIQEAGGQLLLCHWEPGQMLLIFVVVIYDTCYLGEGGTHNHR
jgi:hypothetical protein